MTSHSSVDLHVISVLPAIDVDSLVQLVAVINHPELDLFAISSSNSQIHGKMNGGGQALTIHTGDGSIRLSKSS